MECGSYGYSMSCKRPVETGNWLNEKDCDGKPQEEKINKRKEEEVNKRE